MKKLYPYLLVSLAMFFWASSFIVMKFAFNYMGPITMTFLRMLIASAIMPILYLALPQRDRIKKEHISHFALLAFFEPFIYFIGESNGMVYVPASYGAVIISLIPLITPIFAWFIIKEPITRWGIWGTVISFIGVIVIVLEKEDSAAALKGVALLCLAVAGAVGYGIKLRQIAHHYKPVTIVMIQTWFGLLYFLPVFIIFEANRYFTELPPVVAYYPVIALAVFCTCGSFLLFTSGIKKIGLNNANILSNLIPVFTVILAYIFIDEPVSLRKLAGILVVISGLFLSQIPNLRKRI